MKIPCSLERPTCQQCRDRTTLGIKCLHVRADGCLFDLRHDLELGEVLVRLKNYIITPYSITQHRTTELMRQNPDIVVAEELALSLDI